MNNNNLNNLTRYGTQELDRSIELDRLEREEVGKKFGVVFDDEQWFDYKMFGKFKPKPQEYKGWSGISGWDPENKLKKNK